MINASTILAGDSITVGLAPYVQVQGQKLTIAKGGMPAAWLLGEFKRRESELDAYSYLVVLIGTNDMGGPLSPETIFSQIQEIWRIAKKHGLFVFACTIPPFDGWSTYRPSWDDKRHAVNEMILRSDLPDMVIPLHTMLADISDPNALAKAFDSGDHLHPRKDKLGPLIQSQVEEYQTKPQVVPVFPPAPLQSQPQSGSALILTLVTLGVAGAYLTMRKYGKL